MSVLVIAEHEAQLLKKSTLSTVAAGLQLADTVDVLVAGSAIAAVAESACAIQGVQTVLLADHPCYQHNLVEALAPLIVHLADRYDAILAPATSFGKNIMPAVAARLDVGQVSDVVAIIDATHFKRYIYAGNALATVESLDDKRILTVRPTAFDAVTCDSGSAKQQIVDFVSEQKLSEFVELKASNSDLPSLSDAAIVISGGRGLQNQAGFDRLARIAEKMHAALGASRAAVDAGLAANDCQVGQTGQIVAPTLYFAVGISGAIQHLAGMKDSKVIVAINKDAEAPIFEIADYALVADLNDVLPEWEAWLAQKC